MATGSIREICGYGPVKEFHLYDANDPHTPNVMGSLSPDGQRLMTLTNDTAADGSRLPSKLTIYNQSGDPTPVNLSLTRDQTTKNQYLTWVGWGPSTYQIVPR